jgi:hypothetical protein
MSKLYEKTKLVEECFYKLYGMIEYLHRPEGDLMGGIDEDHFYLLDNEEIDERLAMICAIKDYLLAFTEDFERSFSKMVAYDFHWLKLK